MNKFTCKVSISKTLFLSCIISIFIFSLANISLAGEDPWRNEFNELCDKTQEAMALTGEELKTLIDRSNNLLSIIEASDSPGKKTYLFRLKKCKNFYQFIIDSKKERGSVK